MQLKSILQTKILSLTIALVLVISPLLISQGFGLHITSTTEYANYVHTHLNSETLGNYTIVEKPIFPVMINNSQIQVGKNWTVIYPLVAGHNYHVYCYGTWVNMTAAAKTDYDIYVYDPQGNLESSHTEAAGFPEHLGTTTSDSLFTPKQSGNYSFVIKNDPRESEGSQQATFMIMETLECEKWYTQFIEGKTGESLTRFHTSWAYEFVTNESKVELYVKVPENLDMYEARLYLMNDAKSPSVNSYPLPWEPGLYGNVSTRMGGYNFEHEGYRGVAYASCEYRGQAMFLNYSSTNVGPKLYHLVLIGEEGSGNVEFMLKSRFGNTSLTSLVNLKKVLTDIPTKISYMSNNASLENAQLLYTSNNWTSVTNVSMEISNKTCNATIPGQKAGTVIQFRINANDNLKNKIIATGNYTVKTQPILYIKTFNDTVRFGENLTVTGNLTPTDNSSIVRVQFSRENITQVIDCYVGGNSTFVASFIPELSGLWIINATSLETKTSWNFVGPEFAIIVNEPPIYVKYWLYIVIGLVVTVAVGGLVYFFKFRER